MWGDEVFDVFIHQLMCASNYNTFSDYRRDCQLLPALSLFDEDDVLVSNHLVIAAIFLVKLSRLLSDMIHILHWFMSRGIIICSQPIAPWKSDGRLASFLWLMSRLSFFFLYLEFSHRFSPSHFFHPPLLLMSLMPFLILTKWATLLLLKE